MRKPQRPRLVIFAVLSTITFITWISLDLLRTFTKPAPIEISPELLEEFNPTLKTETLNKIENRTFFSNDEVIKLAPQLKKQETTSSGQEQPGESTGTNAQ